MPDAIKPLQKQLNIENVIAIPTFAPCCSVPNEPIEKPRETPNNPLRIAER